MIRELLMFSPKRQVKLKKEIMFFLDLPINLALYFQRVLRKRENMDMLNVNSRARIFSIKIKLKVLKVDPITCHVLS